jgi:tetratricopeptide (TPR) repeat protein
MYALGQFFQRGTAVVAMLLWALSAYGMHPVAKEGFQHFYNLEYDQAIKNFQQEIENHPAQADGYNHLAQAILYRALFRSGILENSLASGNDLVQSLIRQPKLELNPAEEREFQRALNTSFSVSQTQLRANPDDSAAMYALGVANGLRANYDFLVRKAWLGAIRESNTARQLHNRVLELDPGNIDARMMQGVQEYVVASLPVALRVLGAVAGLHADKDAGLRTLEIVATQGTDNKVEARMLLTTLYRREKQPQIAMSHLRGLRAAYPRNYLLHLAEICTLIEMKDGRAAAESLQSFGHLERAMRSLNHEVASDPSATEIRLLAYQRLGMIHDLKGQRQLALQAYRRVVDEAPDSLIAKQSQRYLDHPFQGSTDD